jgi:uncharacterized glyoxalase superfamily protein PhnB
MAMGQHISQLSGQTEEAFAFYAKTFGTEFTMLSRYSDFPATGPRELPAEERNLVTHAELSIIAGHVLMAMDILRSMGQETRIDNNTSVCLDLDSREEANRVYGALSAMPAPVASTIRKPSSPSMATSAKSHGFAEFRAAVSRASNCR